MLSRSRSVLALAIVGIAASLVSAPTTAGAGQMPTAVHIRGVPKVGPLFTNGTAQPHGCTGSVVHSRSHDTVLMAAHCGVRAGMLFAPGYDNGATPYGVWRISKVFVDSAWATHRDPQHDYAILKMGRLFRAGRWQMIEEVTGAYVLGTAPRTGSRVIVVGYPIGIRDRPIRCVATVYLTGGYPSFDCHGYVGGTSGSPWLVPGTRGHAATVVGVIGGLEHGGRYEYTSYTSAFGRPTATLLAQAAT